MSRYTVWKQRRNKGRIPDSEKEKINSQQERLQRRIISFLKTTARVFPSIDLVGEFLNDTNQSPRFTSDAEEDDEEIGPEAEVVAAEDKNSGYLEDQADEAQDEGGNRLEDDEAWIEDDGILEDDEEILLEGAVKAPDRLPEAIRLPLPSLLGRVRSEQLGLTSLVQQEVLLRKGTAHDALEELRISLAHKAAIFRTDLRHAKATGGKSRAWGNVRLVEAKVSL